jgi:leucyl-tRNA synthetase
MRAAPILRPAEEAATLASAFAWDETWIYSEGFMAGLPASEGRNQVMQRLQETGSGSPAVRYRLRDWSIARQRYWGPPVPVVYCPRCGPTGVPDDELPVRLPMDVDLPASNPLAAHAQFMKTTCPRCRSDAQRDSDTLEAYSSPWWYHWVCKGTATANPFDVEECRLYMPVDLLIGGEDQARTCFFHARMMARALKRAGVVEHEEPISGLLAIGMVKVNGRKMSKSEGNTVSPRNLMERYGADALRCAILGAAAPDSDLNWSDELAAQACSFMAGVWRFFETNCGHIRFEALSSDTPVDTGYSMSKKLARQVETAVARTTSALEGNLFHLAVRNLQMLFERIESYQTEAVRRRKIPDERDRMALAAASRVFLRLLAPICPHMAEEIWSVCGGEGLAAQAPWPAIAGVQKGAGR